MEKLEVAMRELDMELPTWETKEGKALGGPQVI